LHALTLLDHPGYFGLRAESEAGSTPPLSCLNDGVQIGSGCTTGKGNLVIVGDNQPRVRFVTKAGKAASIEVQADVLAAIRRGEIDEYGAALRHPPLDELFAWTSL
jgi:formylmethanofuran dehydrogenase subunit E